MNSMNKAVRKLGTKVKIIDLDLRAGVGNIFFPEGYTDLDKVSEVLQIWAVLN